MDPKNIRSVTDFYGSSDDEVVDEGDVEGDVDEGVNIFPTSRIPDTSSSISETNSDVFNTNFPITGATTPVTNSDATTPFDTTPFETVPFTTPIDEDEDDDGDNAKFETKLKLAVPDGTTFSLVTDLNEHYVTHGVKLMVNIGRKEFTLGRFDIKHSLSMELAKFYGQTYEYFLESSEQIPTIMNADIDKLTKFAKALNVMFFNEDMDVKNILNSNITFTGPSQSGIPKQIDIPEIEDTPVNLNLVKTDRDLCTSPITTLEHASHQFKLARRSAHCILAEYRVNGIGLTWHQLYAKARDLYMEMFSNVVPWDIYSLIACETEKFDIHRCKEKLQKVISNINYIDTDGGIDR